jgi:hypothetical protein
MRIKRKPTATSRTSLKTGWGCGAAEKPKTDVCHYFACQINLAVLWRV